MQPFVAPGSVCSHPALSTWGGATPQLRHRPSPVSVSLCVCPCAPECYIREGRRRPHPYARRLGDLTVAPGAVLWRTLRRPDGFGAFEAVAFAASGGVGQRVGPTVHHDGVHAVRHGERLQMALDGYWKRQLIDQVHRGTGNNGATAQVLQTEYCNDTKDKTHTIELQKGDQEVERLHNPIMKTK